MNTTDSLKNLYVKMGGSLTDTYVDIASGVPVSEYNTIPDCINAIANVSTGSGTEEARGKEF